MKIQRSWYNNKLIAIINALGLTKKEGRDVLVIAQVQKPEHEVVDALADMIVFSVGALLKQGVDVTITEYEGLVKFQVDRGLNKLPYDKKVEVLHIMEELIESTDVGSNEARVMAQEILTETPSSIDHLAVIKQARNTIDALGYNVRCVIDEVSKEVNSREGSMIDGKFVKDKSPEAQAKWYKADFTKCIKTIDF